MATTVRSGTAPVSLFENLESRRLLSFKNLTTFLDPDDGELVTVELTGPGKLAVDAGQRTISLFGTTAASSLVVSVKQSNNGRLAWGKIQTDGSIQSISAPTVDFGTGLVPGIQVAGAAKSITMGDLLTGDVSVLTPGVTVTNIRGRFVSNSTLHLGRVGTMDFDNLTLGVVITTDRITALTVHNQSGGPGQLGVAARFSITQPGGAPYAIKTIVIEGDFVGGEWSLGAGDVQSIRINRIIQSLVFVPTVTVTGRIGSLKGLELRGHWTAGSFGAIASAGDFNGQFTTTAGGYDSIRGVEFRSTFTAAAGAGVKSVVAGFITTMSIDADFVDAITVTDGDAAIGMTLHGLTNRAYQLRNMTVAGVLSGHIDINGNVHTMTLGGAEDLFLNVGATPPAFEGFITSAAQVAAGKGTVQVLKIKARVGDPESFSTSVFNVRRIITLVTTARTNVLIPLALFGFRFVELPGTVNIRISVPGLADQFITNPATTSIPPVFQFTYQQVV